MGTAILPSHNAMYDASIPSILSSMIILFPASPKIFFTSIVSIAASASSVLSQTSTPFPAARPSAFTTRGCDIDFTYSVACFASSNISNSAVRILFLCMNCFAHILLDSS